GAEPSPIAVVAYAVSNESDDQRHVQPVLRSVKSKTASSRRLTNRNIVHHTQNQLRGIMVAWIQVGSSLRNKVANTFIRCFSHGASFVRRCRVVYHTSGGRSSGTP